MSEQWTGLQLDPGEVPPNGLLSGMIITVLAGVVMLVFCGFHSSALAVFGKVPSPSLMQAVFLSFVLMAVHKAESFWEEEFNHCPVYMTSGRAPWAQNSRKAIFLTFISTFLGMLALIFLVMLGPPWPLALIGVWIAQGLHELHHLAKSWVRGHFYPGVFSSLVFVAVQSFVVFPRWHDLIFQARGALFISYYGLMPFVLFAFVWEDSGWILRFKRAASYRF